MKNYSYVAKDSTGKTLKGVMEAEDEQQVQEKVYEQGLFLISTTEALGGTKTSIYKFKTKDLAFSCRQLAAMLTSGLTIVKALDIMYKEEKNKGAKNVWLALYEDVNKGSNFTEALIARNGSFPDFMISMIDAGESAGNLDITVQRLSDFYANQNKTQNIIKSAMMYPIILGVLTIVMVIGMFTFIMPTFAGLMSEEEMPALSRALFKFSYSPNFLGRNLRKRETNAANRIGLGVNAAANVREAVIFLRKRACAEMLFVCDQSADLHKKYIEIALLDLFVKGVCRVVLIGQNVHYLTQLLHRPEVHYLVDRQPEFLKILHVADLFREIEPVVGVVII